MSSIAEFDLVAEVPTESLAQATILIVDDDPVSRLITRSVLTQGHYKIIEADSGKDALKLYWQHSPDLVLLDAVMPDLDGFEVCAQLRAHDEQTPVLMITRLEDEGSVDRAFQAGADDYITKPIHRSVLRHRVAGIIKSLSLQRRITRLAYHDTVTKLPNRQLLLDRLNRALAHARREHRQLALLFLDLDNFKTVNDTFGHEQGDVLLRTLAQRLLSCLREKDTVARLGGDEFIILLDDIQNPDNAAHVAEKLLRAVHEPVQLQDQKQQAHYLRISCSVGIALYPSDGAQANVLLKNADTAMYQAKHQGRHRFQFYANEMSATVLRRVMLINSIDNALQDDQLSLSYQPRFDLKTGTLKAMDAQLNWQHPELGSLSSDEFIPLTHDLDLLSEIGAWRLRHICQQGAAWQADLPDLRITCNLTTRELIQPKFFDTLLDIIDTTGFEGRYLEFELKDGIGIEYIQRIKTAMQCLRGIAVQFVIDDFSDGRLSLRDMATMPFSALKIDCSSLSIDHPDDLDSTLIKTIANISHNLHLKMLATRVNSETQARFLQQIGCSEVQGALFAKPSLAKAANLTQNIAYLGLADEA
jgi:diguanylate cyclase (GGDEF)-like protein